MLAQDEREIRGLWSTSSGASTQVLTTMACAAEYGKVLGKLISSVLVRFMVNLQLACYGSTLLAPEPPFSENFRAQRPPVRFVEIFLVRPLCFVGITGKAGPAPLLAITSLLFCEFVWGEGWSLRVLQRAPSDLFNVHALALLHVCMIGAIQHE